MVFGIKSESIVNRKDIALGFALHYFTPSYLQCSHYLSQIPQPVILYITYTYPCNNTESVFHKGILFNFW